MGAGFSELRWFYGGWLEIMGDHDVSLGFVVFPDVTAVWGHIFPNMSSVSGYIGRLIPYLLSRPVGLVVSLLLARFLAVYFVSLVG